MKKKNKTNKTKQNTNWQSTKRTDLRKQEAPKAVRKCNEHET